MKALFLVAWCVKTQALLHSQMTLSTLRSLAFVFPRRPNRRVLSHTYTQPEPLVTKLCIFRKDGRAGAALRLGQPEPRDAWLGNQP